METPTTFHHRSTFRPNTQDRSKQWRERFRQQCAERVKSARQNQVDKRRQNKLLQLAAMEEWENFKRIHEEAFKAEGIVDPDKLLEEEQLDDTDEYLDEEAAYLRSLVFCFQCSNAPLELDISGKLRCPCCGFFATEKTVHSIQITVEQHEQVCPGRIGYSPEPGSDAIYGLCDTCDLMEVF
ncbi:hypothetical protein LRAMOSA01832 [Lichtheimia ramosa]|uniref:RPA-interacting protein C-terminal domain-containing protein n=1 Tax=Lichtheimia ramosa TaxID=688394 RepID=A0A077WL32_9FUNG|nr:hypothetical protein LRAMOSA01832 [Lichtheimia ramosa]